MEVDCDGRDHVLGVLTTEQLAQLGDEGGQTSHEICQSAFEDTLACIGEHECLDLLCVLRALRCLPPMAEFLHNVAGLSILSEERCRIIDAVGAIETFKVVKGEGPAQPRSGCRIDIG